MKLVISPQFLLKLSLIACSFVTIGQESARAAHWERHYECSGSDSSINWEGVEQQNPWANPNTGEEVRGSSNFTATAFESGIAARSSGTVTAVFTWTPDFEGDLQRPPAEALFKETGSAAGYTSAGCTFNVSNGLGDPAGQSH